MEETFRLTLEEKDEKINVMHTQVNKYSGTSYNAHSEYRTPLYKGQYLLYFLHCVCDLLKIHKWTIQLKKT